MVRNILETVIGYIVVVVTAVITVLGGIVVLITYMRSIGITITTASDMLTLVTVVISMTALVVTIGWSYWAFRITSHEYYPGLKLEFVKVPPFMNTIDERFVLKLMNVSKRDTSPSEIVFTGTWFDGPRKYEQEMDYITPQEAIKIRMELPYPKPGSHTVFVRVIDEEFSRYWNEDKDFYMPKPEEIMVVP